MSAEKMHADEFGIDAFLVRRLLGSQFPQWADLALLPVRSDGTANTLFRLGDEMVVRLPRTHGAVAGLQRELEWLPVLAPRLPLAVPVPLARGQADREYPWDWAVYRWLVGENATPDRIADLCQFAKSLAQFVAALRELDPRGGPAPRPTERGVPLADRDQRVRAAIEELEGEIDRAAVVAAWEQALRAPVWEGPGVWLHGDLYGGNMLVVDGRLSAVLDFGSLSVGDPAPDLIIAWSLFSGEAREVFRQALNTDPAMWERGRGWALSVALIALPYYRTSNPYFVALSRRMIAEVLADAQS
ncbi:MAG: aminoglycoside phosphotransferase family protein [Candidatus Sericytochromatia bacterium]